MLLLITVQGRFGREGVYASIEFLSYSGGCRCSLTRGDMGWRRPVVAGIILVLSSTRAFVLNGGVSNSNPGALPGGAFRWSLPDGAADSEGLGGGLGWVLASDFCESILGRFPERDLVYGLSSWAFQFVHCSDLRDALERGFQTWSANHRLISFSDLGNTKPCSDPDSITGELTDSCPWELYISTADGKENPALAAFVINHRVSAFRRDWHSRPLRAPSGHVAYGVDAHARSVMRFQTHLCWYLDATFCYYFQVLHEKHEVDVLLIVRAVLLCAFTLAVMRIASILFWCIIALCCLPDSRRSRIRKRGGCSTGCSACLDYLSSLSPLLNVLVLFLIIFPPIFYERIFMPCWECYDFEAAMAHETGHVLGFGHPDAVPENNLAAKCRITDSTCNNPFADCAVMSTYQPAQKSIMHSLTQHSPRTCLSEEDMAGLYFLYPICDNLQPMSVSCVKSRRLSGWLRLAIVVGIPFLLAVLLILVPLSCLRYRDARIMKQLDRELGSAHTTIQQYQQELNKALRSTARDVVNRPATAFRNNANRPGTALNRITNKLGGRSGRINPTDAPDRVPAHGGAGGDGRAAAGVRRAQVVPEAMMVEEVDAPAAGDAPRRPKPKGDAARRPKPGGPKKASNSSARAGGRVVQGRPVELTKQGTLNGYTGIAWPGAPPRV